MCRALQVLCVAGGEPSLDALKRAAVGQEWEVSGAVGAEAALRELSARSPHILVVWGAFGDLVRQAREASPGLRIVAVGRSPMAEADVNLSSIKDVRNAILGVPPPGGPVRT